MKALISNHVILFLCYIIVWDILGMINVYNIIYNIILCIYWLVVWNIFIFPYIGNNHFPLTNIIFSRWLKPPTSIYIKIYDDMGVS